MTSELDTLIRNVDRLLGVYEAREQQRLQLAEAVEALDLDITVLGQTDAALTALLAQTSEENLQAIEELISSGLSAVFTDLSLSFKFLVDKQRGQQSLVPVLVNSGVEGPILDSHGGGPASVVAVLLRILVVHKLGLAPFIVLDESLSMLSAEYVANAATFLVGLCERLGLTIVLVTHQDAFIEAATKAYRIASGPDGASFTQLP